MAATSYLQEGGNGVASKITEAVQRYDVIVIGAGFTGVANLYRLRKDGLNVHVFESGMFSYCLQHPVLEMSVFPQSTVLQLFETGCPTIFSSVLKLYEILQHSQKSHHI
jgi:2-polyprenyl-6-methoxyphenol hydroxylase-like FAD-dependent oxidoreductase